MGQACPFFIFYSYLRTMKQQHYEGLTKEEVLESRQRNGSNVLSEPEKVLKCIHESSGEVEETVANIIQSNPSLAIPSAPY